MEVGLEDNKIDKKVTVEKMRDSIEMENLDGLTPLGLAAENHETVEDGILSIVPNILEVEDDAKSFKRIYKSPEKHLIRQLEACKPEAFKEKLEMILQTKQNLNFDFFENGVKTMLQHCCILGYHELVDILLTKGADPNGVSSNDACPPIVLAGQHGYYKVIGVFLRKFLEDNIYVDFTKTGVKSKNVLHNIFEAESKAYDNKHLVDYQKCLNLFLHNENELVRSSLSAASNGQDHLGNTPLHLAGDTNNREASRWLIRCGARLNIKNDMELNPYVPPDVMREFLDSCIRDH